MYFCVKYVKECHVIFLFICKYPLSVICFACVTVVTHIPDNDDLCMTQCVVICAVNTHYANLITIFRGDFVCYLSVCDTFVLL